MRLQDELHPRVKRAYWIAQRAIWAGMAVVLIAALAGIAGNGPASDQTKRVSTGGVEVEVDYARWARQRSPHRLVITVRAPEVQGDQLSVTLSNTFVDNITLRAVVPDASDTEVGEGGVTYLWSVQEWTEPVVVEIEYAPDDWRTLDGEVTVAAGDAAAQRIEFRQIVMP